uniref:Uncharacterized protein n=1 Tax=viral metagenome TaxID=1070528 RepID=A0A2V0R9I4_9ZZZZ
MTTSFKQFSNIDNRYTLQSMLPAFTASSMGKTEARAKGLRFSVASALSTGVSYDSGSTYDFNTDVGIHNLLVGQGMYKIRTKFLYEGGTTALPGTGDNKRDYFAVVTPSVFENGTDTATAGSASGGVGLSSHGFAIAITSVNNWNATTIRLNSSNIWDTAYYNNEGFSQTITGNTASALVADTVYTLDIVFIKRLMKKEGITNPNTGVVTPLGSPVYDVMYDGYARLDDSKINFSFFGGTVPSLFQPTYFVAGATDSHTSNTNPSSNYNRYTVESSVCSYTFDFDVDSIILEGI